MNQRHLVAGAIVIVGLVVVWSILKQPDTGAESTDNPEEVTSFEDLSPLKQKIVQANEALKSQDYEGTLQLAEEVLAQDPVSGSALILAAQASSFLGNFENAVSFFKRVPEGEQARAFALNQAAMLEFDALKKITAAENTYKMVLRLVPGEPTVVDRLVDIMILQGRRWEAQPWLFGMLIGRGDRMAPDRLMWMGLHDAILATREPELIAFSEEEPKDPYPKMGLAFLEYQKYFNSQGDLRKAEELIRDALYSIPTHSDAQALLGRILLELDDQPALVKWNEDLPPEVDVNPRIWVVRGRMAQRRDQGEAAARCFWEALRINPNHKLANLQISKELRALGKTEKADEFGARAALLADFEDSILTFKENPTNFKAVEQIAQTAEKLGRVWEAGAWYNLVTNLDPAQTWGQENFSRLVASIEAMAPRPGQTLDDVNPVLDFSLEEFAIAELSEVPEVEDGSTTVAEDVTDAVVKFTNVNEAAGIDFSYETGRLPGAQDSGLHSETGGGAAVIDFDGDYWPDFHFTQGAEWPYIESQELHLDRMYRNRGDGTFEDVSALAGVTENGYSQGAAVGDFNNDGFPDLYIGNIGGNRLYQNNGDGTFTDVSERLGDADTSWTTSCAIADINGDGIPDIYDVNYLSGDDVFTMICQDANNQPRECGPRGFSAARDRVLIQNEVGDFQDESETAGVQLPNGKGLGLVVCDLDGSGNLEIYISNDSTRNSLFQATAASAEASAPAYTDIALLAGAAVNPEGNSQGSMGIAVGDIDQNGLLDVFVANYVDEENNLFSQVSALQFVDQSKRFGIDRVGYPLSAFGTQFLDLEHDGLLDLMVCNGNVGGLYEPYEMPAHLFSNVDGKSFAQLEVDGIGEYFQVDHVGRALAKIDYNRDGNDDLLITQLNEPNVLLRNDTSSAGNQVSIQLRGTKLSRDAIGSFVTITAGEQVWTQQLMAGDGYQASNHRRVTFGLGSVATLDRVEVQWPGGALQAWESPAINSELLVIEGDAELHPLPNSATAP